MELGIVLPPQLPKCWDDSYEPPCPIDLFLLRTWGTEGHPGIGASLSRGLCAGTAGWNALHRRSKPQMLYQDRGLRDKAMAQLADCWSTAPDRADVGANA